MGQVATPRAEKSERSNPLADLALTLDLPHGPDHADCQVCAEIREDIGHRPLPGDATNVRWIS